MNTGDSCRTSLPALLITLLITLILGRATNASAAGISEPPLVIHGKVVKLAHGGSYQLFDGTLRLKLINSGNPENVLDVVTSLRKVGTNGEFSYRIEIDQQTDPAPDKLMNTLVAGSGFNTYGIQSITVNGYPARLLDPAQSAEISSGFAERGKEMRVDFETDHPTPDTDGDGMTDWWEQLHGLDPADSSDALVDSDADGWSNLKEFNLGTDPLVANSAPLLQDSLLVVSAGGSAGVHLSIADADTAPENLRLTLLDGGEGLTWKRSGATQQPGDAFSYADVLAGRISADVSTSFIADTLRFRLEDLTTAGVNPQELVVGVEAFSPTRRWLGEPVLWLDAGTLSPGAPVAEWADASGLRNVGYQPYADARPVADARGRLGFDGSQFLYVDDRGERLGEFSMFVACEPGAETEANQTLFSSQDVEVGIGGPQAGIHGRSLTVVQSGRVIHGPVVDSGAPMQFSISGERNTSALRIPGLGSFGSSSGDVEPLSTFTTVGARQQFSSAQAANFFQGSLREVLVFDRKLNPESRRMIEDYQMSRWQRVRLWNYRYAALPIIMTGANGVRNSISGGDSNDTLAGADQADLLNGGRGDNRLTGKGGGDHFLISRTGGNDVITDFSVTDGDVIDLTDVFAGMTGLPSRYVKVTTLVTRDANNSPRVDSRLHLVYDGVGTTADQTIILEGVGIGNSDLPRLVGEGALQLGGPRYDTEIGLAVSGPDPATGNGVRHLTVSRTGNTDAAIRVPLNLGGDAGLDVDYQLVGSIGTGSIRSVTLARGAAQGVFALVLTPGSTRLPASVSVTTLPVPQVSDGGATVSFTLSLPADDTLPTLAIRTVNHVHQQLGLNGLAQVYRTGGLDQALEVPLIASGSRTWGVEIEALPESVHFAAGQSIAPVAVIPIGNPPGGTEVPTLLLSVAANPARYNLGSPSTATILWVSQGGEDAALSYFIWSDGYFPGNYSSGLENLDSDQDGKSNLMEFLAASNPTHADDEDIDFSIVPVAGGLEVRWVSVRALTDVRVDLEESGDLRNWARSPLSGTEKLTTLPDGSIRHAYRLSADPATRSRQFRLVLESLPTAP